MNAKLAQRTAIAVTIPALVVGLAAPTHAATLSSEYASLSSEYAREQGLFSQHTVALTAAQFNSKLSEEQRHALWYGPTDEAQVQACLKKYGLDGDDPWPDIAVRMDCSVDVIDADLYQSALDLLFN